MSVVKQKLNNVSLIQKCKIIRLIEKEITDNSAFEKKHYFDIDEKQKRTFTRLSANHVKYKKTSRMRLRTSG